MSSRNPSSISRLGNKTVNLDGRGEGGGNVWKLRETAVTIDWVGDCRFLALVVFLVLCCFFFFFFF